MKTSYTESNSLDSAWITEFKKLETEYNDFYKEIPRSVNIFNIYINENNMIVSIDKNSASLDKRGRINKETLLEMVQQSKKKWQEKRVILDSMLKYNFTLHNEKLLHMVLNNYDNKEKTLDYLTEVSTLDNLVFKETIHFFSQLNAIYFIYKEMPSHKKHRMTKKIYLRANKKVKRSITRCKRT